jgi:hypothetical protein
MILSYTDLMIHVLKKVNFYKFMVMVNKWEILNKKQKN